MDDGTVATGGQFQLGTATKVITPTVERGASLGGFFRRERATRALDDLHARAVFLTGGTCSTSFLLVACELLGLPYKSSALVRKAISRRTGVPVERVAIHCTHTHSGPDATGIFRVPIIRSIPRAFPEVDVLNELHAKIVEAGVAATDPANLSGPVQFAHGSVIPDPPLAVRRRGARQLVERPVSVLSLATPVRGKLVPRAVVVNYAAHPTFIPAFSATYSADYPGAVVRRVEQSVGPGTTVLYLNGACGDVSIRYGAVGAVVQARLLRRYPELDPDSPLHVPGAFLSWNKTRRRKYAFDWRVEGAEEYGGAIGEWALKALDDARYAPLRGVAAKRKTLLVELGVVPFPKTKWNRRHFRHSLRKLKNWLAFRFKVWAIPFFYRAINRMDPHFLALVRRSGRTFVRTEVSAARLDGPSPRDAAYLLFAPGEPFAGLAEKVKAMTGTPRVLFGELTNDSPGYVFGYREFVLGGYENSFAFSPLTGDAVVSGFKHVLLRLGRANDRVGTNEGPAGGAPPVNGAGERRDEGASAAA
ncbi:MAG: hypothetical protein Kow0069_02770 [Promethearchaeota archaeon]